jgi:hypothetical protein
VAADLITLPCPSYRPLGRLALFRPGKTAYLNGRGMTVSYVHVRNGDLLVYLQGHAAGVPADQLQMEVTELVWPQDRLVEYHERLQRKASARNSTTTATATATAQDQAMGAAAMVEPSQAVAIVEEQSSTDDIFAQAMG